jgi:formylglycine-generating enzyme required for sulfatase activity
MNLFIDPDCLTHKTGELYSLDIGGVIFEMIYVAASKYLMGVPDVKPGYKIVLSRGFWLGKFPVTQRQYEAVMKKNPSFFSGRPDNPVENISWHDSQRFIKKLNAMLPPAVSGLFRLPYEAEWECAARAGSKHRFYWGDDPDYLLIDDYAWYNKNSGASTRPVGGKPPNKFGFYDTAGSVWEWCADWHGGYGSGAAVDPRGPKKGECRVMRGGSWDASANGCRVCGRYYYIPSYRYNGLGMRLAFSAAI